MQTNTQSKVLNIVFCPNAMIKFTLKSICSYFGQDTNYCFIYNSDCLFESYDIYEQMLHKIHPAIPFRLIYFFESDQKNKELIAKLIKLNSYSNRYKLKCIYLNHLNIKSRFPYKYKNEGDKDLVTTFPELYYYDKKRYAFEKYIHDFQFLTEGLDDISGYTNLINFWKRFDSIVNTCRIIDVPQLSVNHQIQQVNIVLVNDYDYSYYWTKLANELHSSERYVFIPGLTWNNHDRGFCFDETLRFLELIKPQIKIRLVALISDEKNSLPLFNKLKKYSNKGKQHKLRIYTYWSLNLNKIIHKPYELMYIYGLSFYNWPEDDGFNIRHRHINLENYHFHLTPEQGERFKSLIWYNLVRIVEPQNFQLNKNSTNK